MQNYLTQKQTDILIGSVLGDGGLYSDRRYPKSCSYYVKQAEKNKDYIFWLYNQLKLICFSSPKQRKDNGQWYFRSSFSQNLCEWQDKFYKNNCKIIPDDIGKVLISPLSVAIWYMDDGTLDYRPHNHCSFSFSTHSFELKEAEKLVKVLKDNFSVKANVNYNLIRGKRYPRIYIGKEGRDEFIKLVSPFILDCFKYKLPQYRKPLRDFSKIKIEGWQDYKLP